MNASLATIAALKEHPRLISFIGTVSGWASFDLLRASQITAAILAGLVSLCALILTGPKAIEEVKKWFRGKPNPNQEIPPS